MMKYASSRTAAVRHADTGAWPLDGWPDVPTRFILCRNDRLLPAPFLRRVVHERVGITPDEIDAPEHENAAQH